MTRLPLFTGIGIELEYMIVSAETLDVLPIADRVLLDEAGAVTSELEMGSLAWSNELASHVLELKTNGPTATLEGVAEQFQRSVRDVNARLAEHGARLMPTAMHPWMDPHSVRLWPHDYGPVYEAFNRIFDCRGHGWANVQSVHINLPFATDDEFARLHAAIRIVMPLLPALAASSPFADGHTTGWLDTRMEYYRTNTARVPSVTALVVPEAVVSEDAYQRDILAPMYRDLAPLDPAGHLHDEWVNARGAIARFDRGTIEIRVLDMQECPAADLAIAAAIVATLTDLASGRISDVSGQNAYPTEQLHQLLLHTIRAGDRAPVPDDEYPTLIGAEGATAGDVWSSLIDRHVRHDPRYATHVGSLDVIRDEGCLARRILDATGHRSERSRLLAVYRELADCLATGAMLSQAS